MSARDNPAVPSKRRARWALGALLLLAAAQRAWNAWAVPPLAGYDEPAHGGYFLSLLLEQRLPHPFQGWVTFHPPFYYLLGSAVWTLLSPLGPHAVTLGLRALGSLAGLVAGWVTYRIVRRLGGGATDALVATALVLFVPCAVMAASMIGNEAFAAGLAALALPSILALQEDPRRRGAALLAGLFSGLALATKFTGLYVAAACAVPFLRGDLDRAGRRSLAVAALVLLVVAGPIYARHVVLTGSPVPLTRTREPLARAERSLTLRERRVSDYLRFPPSATLRPSIFQIPGRPADSRNRNPAMASVWGLTHASIWYDPFATRLPLRFHRDGVVAGPLLALLGLVPTGVALVGLLGATRRLIRTRGRAPDAPLAVMALSALAMYVLFTWRAPALSSVKGSYLFPVAPAAGVLFVRALGSFPKRARAAILVLSGAAAAASLGVFTCDLLFPGATLGAGGIAEWRGYASELPGSHIDDALTWFLGVP